MLIIPTFIKSRPLTNGHTGHRLARGVGRSDYGRVGQFVPDFGPFWPRSNMSVNRDLSRPHWIFPGRFEFDEPVCP